MITILSTELSMAQKDDPQGIVISLPSNAEILGVGLDHYHAVPMLYAWVDLDNEKGGNAKFRILPSNHRHQAFKHKYWGTIYINREPYHVFQDLS